MKVKGSQVTCHFGPLGHEVCAGGPEVEVQHDDTIQHHHSDENHDEHQIPARTTTRFLMLLLFRILKAVITITGFPQGHLTHLTIRGTAMEVSGKR